MDSRRLLATKAGGRGGFTRPRPGSVSQTVQVPPRNVRTEKEPDTDAKVPPLLSPPLIYQHWGSQNLPYVSSFDPNELKSSPSQSIHNLLQFCFLAIVIHKSPGSARPDSTVAHEGRHGGGALTH